MKRVAVALALAGLSAVTPRIAMAQPLRGLGNLSINSDLNGQVFTGVSGGVLLDLAHAWLSAGAEGDLFISWPYFAGRGGPIVQVNLVRHAPVRIFAIAGMSWGEQAGPMFGGGIEVWTQGRFGLRATVQDYLASVAGFDCGYYGLDPASCDSNFHGGRSFTGHQPTVRIGVVWR
jgi:hypothetical protein